MSDPQPPNPGARAFVRHRRRLDILWQILGLPPRDLVSGRVTDLSIAGVGLTVDQAFAADAHLMLRLPSALRGWTTHLVRVHSCNPAGPGRYKLGCSFVRPLTPDQLRAHLDRGRRGRGRGIPEAALTAPRRR